MISPVFYAALALVVADLGADLKAVADNADTLNDKVSGWSSDDGLAGALVIQQNYDPLSKAVDSLVDSSKGATNDDIKQNVDGVVALSTSVQNLLGSLSSKADDFKAVGASDIVKNDINGLSQSSADIVSNLEAAAGDDIPAELADAANGLGDAFSSAIQAFGANPVEFPEIKAGGNADSGDAETSSAEPSAEPSAESSAESAAGSEGAKTTAAPSKKEGEAQSTETAQETVVETVCDHETCTGVAPANGAARNAVFGGVAAIAAALL